MNRNTLRLFLDWLDVHDLKELLPNPPANPMVGRGNFRVCISSTEEYVKRKTEDNEFINEYNPYLKSLPNIYWNELPVDHIYNNQEGLHVSPEAAVIYRLIKSNNFDCTVDYTDVGEFANV